MTKLIHLNNVKKGEVLINFDLPIGNHVIEVMVYPKF